MTLLKKQINTPSSVVTVQSCCTPGITHTQHEIKINPEEVTEHQLAV
jgi:hypothetical protein